jgi:hypothetical protein
MVDELDLIIRLRDVEPLPVEALDQARTVLHAAMADGQETSRAAGPVAGGRHPRRRAWLAGGAGLGFAAAAAAVALTLTSAPSPRPAAASRPPAGARASAAAPATTNGPLMSLAGYIRANYGRPPGNATLVIRDQIYPGQPAGSGPNPSGVDLYTDGGDYYWATTESGLPAEIAAHETTGGGMFGREVAAALDAVNGNLTTARARMAKATYPPGYTPKPLTPGEIAKITAAVRAREKQVHHKISVHIGKPTPEQQRLSTDNDIWNNCLDALTAGGGDPQVRVGVLRLLATLPEVTVANANRDGAPVLVLTAGSSLFAGTAPQVLTINARSGLPISLSNGVPGQRPDETTTYQVSRVTLAAIEAGRF